MSFRAIVLNLWDLRFIYVKRVVDYREVLRFDLLVVISRNVISGWDRMYSVVKGEEC